MSPVVPATFVQTDVLHAPGGRVERGAGDFRADGRAAGDLRADDTAAGDLRVDESAAGDLGAIKRVACLWGGESTVVLMSFAQTGELQATFVQTKS